MNIKIGTRKSPLALYQAQFVADLLENLDSSIRCELVGIDSTGDIDQSSSLFKIGGQGIFVTAIREAVVDKRVDIAVHSAKDIPSGNVEQLVIAAYPIRADVRDVLVGKSISDLENGDVVRTGSARRVLQLSHLKDGLCFEELRGNIQTRLNKIPNNGSIVVAKAALDRLGINLENCEILSTDIMLPQIGQGAIAVEVSSDNSEIIEVVSQINNVEVSEAMEVERAFLNAIGSDCTWPVGGLVKYNQGQDSLSFEVMLGNAQTKKFIKKVFEISGSKNLTVFGADCAKELIQQAKSFSIL